MGIRNSLKKYSMPKLTNLKTSKVYIVTPEELAAMQTKKHVMRAFRVEPMPDEPDAVKTLKHVQTQNNTK